MKDNNNNTIKRPWAELKVVSFRRWRNQITTCGAFTSIRDKIAGGSENSIIVRLSRCFYCCAICSAIMCTPSPVAVLCWGQGAQPPPPNFTQAPKFFRLLVEVIGSIVISLSRCCLPNDEGPGPQIFFPRTAPA